MEFKNKKKEQLGIDPSTASARLVKDILWSMIVKTNQCNCHQCGLPMTRATFSIEHIVPWLDSDDPVALFFDLDNISFSHLSCNVSAARRNKAPCGKMSSYKRGCRCADCKEANSINGKKYYSTEKRIERFKRTGN